MGRGKGVSYATHSFIDCLASAGVDQRIIDDFVGHQTDQQRRRYRHIFPDVKQDAITKAFAAVTAAGLPGARLKLLMGNDPGADLPRLSPLDAANATRRQ